MTSEGPIRLLCRLRVPLTPSGAVQLATGQQTLANITPKGNKHWQVLQALQVLLKDTKNSMRELWVMFLTAMGTSLHLH